MMAAVRLPTFSFLKIGIDYGFVMHALLALSATHLAWLTDCPLTANMAYEHRGIALKGLHEAIGAFSRQNSDAVLAASLLLSWQATDWSVKSAPHAVTLY
jgi:Fungal specific transcription factor domain